MTTTDDQGHVFLDVTRPDGSHEYLELPGMWERADLIGGETDGDDQ
jgi:hypothetical protein